MRYLPVSMVISQWYVSISALADSLPVLFFSFPGYFFEAHTKRDRLGSTAQQWSRQGLALPEGENLPRWGTLRNSWSESAWRNRTGRGEQVTPLGWSLLWRSSAEWFPASLTLEVLEQVWSTPCTSPIALFRVRSPPGDRSPWGQGWDFAQCYPWCPP